MPRMKRKLSVGIDPVGTLRNTRKSFADPLSFVDELFQNGQRAKATRMDWEVFGDKITVCDDGIGCSDLQKVFTQSVSGWDQETQKIEDSFGVGFFSSILVADEITVLSMGKRAVFDVERMFAESRLDVISVSAERHKNVPGFEVQLRKIRPSVDLTKVTLRVMELARYMPFDTYLAGGKLPRYALKEVLPTESYHEHTFPVKGARFEGVLLFNEYSYPQMYYQRRPVTHLYTTPGIGGRIFVDNGAATLRCPDRQAFIQDDAYASLEAEVKDCIRDSLRGFVAKTSPQDLEKYAKAITANLEVAEYADLVQFDSAYMPPQWFDDFAKQALRAEEIKKDEYLYLEDKLWGRIVELTQKTQAEIDKAAPLHVTIVKNTDGSGFKVNKTETPAGTRLDDIRDRDLVVWAEASEVLGFKDLLKDLSSANVPIIIVRNELQKNALLSLPNTVHVSGAVKRWVSDVHITDQGSTTASETRALKVLFWLQRTLYFGSKEEPIFNIGNLRTYVTMEINGKSLAETKVETKVRALAHQGKAWINREMADFGLLDRIEDPSADVGLNDKAWLTLHVEEISHELAHLLYMTQDDTLWHYERQLAIQGKILHELWAR